MPGGDRTGPLGYGPMTGRAGGFCAGGAPYGRVGYGSGRGFGFGYCRGYRAFGWGRVPGVTGVETARERMRALKEEERWLEENLKALRNEVKEMEREQNQD